MIMPVQSDHPLLIENKQKQEKKPFWINLHIAAGGFVFFKIATLLISAGILTDIFDIFGYDQSKFIDLESYQARLRLAAGFLCVLLFYVGWTITKSLFSIIEKLISQKFIRRSIKVIFVIFCLIMGGLLNVAQESIKQKGADFHPDKRVRQIAALSKPESIQVEVTSHNDIPKTEIEKHTNSFMQESLEKPSEASVLDYLFQKSCPKALAKARLEGYAPKEANLSKDMFHEENRLSNETLDFVLDNNLFLASCNVEKAEKEGLGQ